MLGSALTAGGPDLSMTESDKASELLRRWWFFSLKDRLPLGPDGWSVVVHQPECWDESEHGQPACLTGSVCHADIVRFLGFPTIDNSHAIGLADISSTIEMLNGREPEMEPPNGTEVPDFRWVAAVSTMERSGTPVLFEEAFGLVVDAVTALRNATQVAVPDPSVERVQPMYLIGLQAPGGGEIKPSAAVVVEHVAPGPPPPAEMKALTQAEALLLARFRHSPVEQFRTFSTKARVAVWQEGNYEAAILNAAIACELLLKTLAWMLTLEASRMSTDPCPTVLTGDLVALKPSQLIGQVLQPRLGGNWDSSSEGRPVFEWRSAVAVKRNELLHLGRRVRGGDADNAVHAMTGLVTHVMDRLADRGHIYPRTAFALLGQQGLDRRGRLESVLAALDDATDTADEWIASYVEYVEVLLARG